MNNSEHTPKEIMPNLPLWSYQLQRDSKLALKTRKDLEVHLITRALKDEEFKQELIANPKAVVEKELGAKLPEELEIKVFEETENTLYMVLPCNPYEGMSEEELQASLGMTYEDVAEWVLEQQRNVLLDEVSSIAMLSRAWKDKTFKQELLSHPIKAIEKELKEKIQKDINIQVLVETTNILYLLLPIILDDFEVFDLTNLMSDLNIPIVIGTLPSLNPQPDLPSQLSPTLPLPPPSKT